VDLNSKRKCKRRRKREIEKERKREPKGPNGLHQLALKLPLEALNPSQDPPIHQLD